MPEENRPTVETISVNVPNGTKERIRALADPRGLGVSVWVREVVLRQLAEETPPAAS